MIDNHGSSNLWLNFFKRFRKTIVHIKIGIIAKTVIPRNTIMRKFILTMAAGSGK